jgi:hypothetical protein
MRLNLDDRTNADPLAWDYRFTRNGVTYVTREPTPGQMAVIMGLPDTIPKFTDAFFDSLFFSPRPDARSWTPSILVAFFAGYGLENARLMQARLAVDRHGVIEWIKATTASRRAGTFAN